MRMHIAVAAILLSLSAGAALAGPEHYDGLPDWAQTAFTPSDRR